MSMHPDSAEFYGEGRKLTDNEAAADLKKDLIAIGAEEQTDDVLTTLNFDRDGVYIGHDRKFSVRRMENNGFWVIPQKS